MGRVIRRYLILQLLLYLVLDLAVLFFGLTGRSGGALIPVLILLAAAELLFTALIYRFFFRQFLELEKAIFILNAETEGEHIDWRSAGIGDLIGFIKEMLQNDQTNQIYRTKAEISALQNQINPHFLYNTLETIRSRAMMSGLDDVTEMTEALGLLFRYSISRTGNLATLGEEINHVERYLLIQQYRFPDKISFEKNIEDRRLLDIPIPTLTIQPLVENAIYHGIEVKTGRGTISIHVFATQQLLKIEISDDGTGMTRERLAEVRKALEDPQTARLPGSRGTGIALINVNQRIRFYYGKEYGLQVRSVENLGTVFTLILPLQEGETDTYEE